MSKSTSQTRRAKPSPRPKTAATDKHGEVELTDEDLKKVAGGARGEDGIVLKIKAHSRNA
jgi:hypothetical protein